MVSCGLFVAPVAVVVEKKGAFDAAGRSWELLSGYKWWVFFLLLLTLVIEVVSSILVSFLPALLGGVLMAMESYGGMMFVSMLDAVSSVFVDAFFMALDSVIAATLSHDVRLYREGLHEEDLAAVFD